MGMFRSIVPRAFPGNFTQAPPQIVTRNAVDNTQAVVDAAQLRSFKETIPLLFRGIRYRCKQVANASWSIRPLDPTQDYDQNAIDAATAMLQAPNPLSRNDSFRGLIAPVIDDLITLDLGVIMKKLDGKGRILALMHVDAARIKIDAAWDGDPRTPRYYLTDENDPTKGVPYLNDELIVMSLNDVTYSEIGISPLRVLYGTIQGYKETIQRIRTVQKHGGGSSIVNIADAGQSNLMSIRHRYQAEVEPNSSVMFTDWPIDDVTVYQIGSQNLQQLGTFSYYQILVNEIAACLDMSPMDLMQANQVKYDSAEEQQKMSIDDGVLPLMRDLCGYLSREVVSSFGPNIGMFYDCMLMPEKEEAAADLAALSGIGRYPKSLNDLRIMAGDHPIVAYNTEAMGDCDPMFVGLDVETRKQIQRVYDEPMVADDQGRPQPVSFVVDARNKAEAQAQQMQEQAQQPGAAPTPAAPESPETQTKGISSPAAIQAIALHRDALRRQLDATFQSVVTS